MQVTPQQFAEGAAQFFYGLTAGTPQQRQAALQGLASRYGVSFQQGEPPKEGEPNTVLEQRLAQIEAQQAQQRQFEQQQAQEARQREDQKIADAYTVFADAKNDKGELLHPFIDNVWDNMVGLIRANADSGKTVEDLLEDSYNTAVWANEDTRKAMQALEAKQSQTAHQAQAKKRAADAKRAKSVNLNAKGQHASRRQKPTESIDDTLARVYDEVMAREG